MSSPQAGFPDFGRYTQEAGTSVVRRFNVPLSGPVVIGPFYVGLYESLACSASFTGAASTISANMQFSNDQAGTQIIGSAILRASTGQTGLSVVPVLAEWVTITVQLNAYPVGSAYSFSAEGLAHLPPSSSLLAAKTLSYDPGISIGASSFVTIGPFNQHCDGEVTISARSGGNGVAIELQQSIDNVNFYVVLAAENDNGISTYARGAVDCRTTRVLVRNLNALGQTVSYSVIFR